MSRPDDLLAEIKRLYYGATKATVVRDLDRAIDLLKALPTDEERERAAVYMDGLAQMRSEWGVKPGPPSPRPGGAPGPARKGTPPKRPVR